MPEDWEVQPSLSGAVPQLGVADIAGGLAYTGVTEGSAGEVAFGGPTADFILYGVVNGTFAQGPPDSAANIEPVNNPLPYWTGPTQVSGGAITAKWVVDASSPSSYNLRFTINPGGAAGDDAYVEQIVPIGGSRGRWIGGTVRTTCFRFSLANGGGNFPTVYVSSQCLTASGAETGNSTTATSTLGTSALRYITTYIHAISDSSAPSDAAYVRIRVGARRDTMAVGGSSDIDIADVRLDRALPYMLVAENGSPDTFAPGLILQGSGGLLIAPNGNAAAGPYISMSAASGAVFSAGTGNPMEIGPDVTVSGSLNVSAAVTLTGFISPTALSGATDNWNPTGLATCSIIRASSDANRNLSGIVAQADGRLIRLYNVGSFNISLLDNITSTAANRFLCPNAATLTLNPQDSAEIWYDGTSARWRVMGA